MHHTFIFLVFSSANESVYGDMKMLFELLLEHLHIKYFFIEFRSDQNEEVLEENNHIYVKGEESYIPGIYIKTMKALGHIAENYSYDYVVRSNLSTFWNFPNLFKFLNGGIPKEKFAGGFNVQGFISGTGIIMSRDVGILLHNSPYNFSDYDDVAISNTLRQNNIELYNITEYKWGFLIPICDNLSSNCRYLNINDNDFSDILNFRLKNPDRNTDIVYIKILLNKLYGITA